MEVAHGGHNPAHEAQRRAVYADQVTDQLGDEIYQRVDLCRPGPAASNWRSKVLTPILQRQIAGVPDGYLPALHAGVLDPEEDKSDLSQDENSSRNMTIAEATTFYLNTDPADPAVIPEYRRNIIYTREARWYLSVLLRQISLDDAEAYNHTLWTQEQLADPGEPDERPPEEERSPSPGGDSDEIPKVEDAEWYILLEEGIADFFQDEIAAAVCTTPIAIPCDC